MNTNYIEPTEKSGVKKSVLAVILVAALYIAGVFAYLTATDEKVNNLSIANELDIKVVETQWDALSDAQKQGLEPGQSITKDPAIKNLTDVDAYAFMEVSIPKYDGDKLLFTPQWNNSWSMVDLTKTDTEWIYTYAYNNVLAGNETTSTLFDTVKVADFTNGEVTASAQQIVVTGHAIQIGDFESVFDAWYAYKAAQEEPTVIIDNITVYDDAIEADTTYEIVRPAKMKTVASATAIYDDEVEFTNVPLVENESYVVIEEGTSVDNSITEFVADEATINEGGLELGEPKTAFVVYSATDNSLNFYKRTEVPEVGSTWDDGRGVSRVATGVYEGIETACYGSGTNKYGSQYQPWFNHRTNIQSVTFVDNGIRPKYTDCWFYGMKNSKFTSITGLNKLDTSEAKSMYAMFSSCEYLKSLDVSDWDVSNVSQMYCLFYGCSSITSLDLSNWNMSSVVRTPSMFYECSSLTSIGDISNWNTSKLMYSAEMFRKCTSLKSLDLSGWDTSKLSDTSGMFSGCSNLVTIDLSGWDTSNVTNMSWGNASLQSYYYGTFYNCSKLKTIYVGYKWTTRNNTAPYYMFYGCTSLVGGAGTTFNSSKTDDSMAHIDSVDNPGYLSSNAMASVNQAKIPLQFLD